jgi:hypothetical protein
VLLKLAAGDQVELRVNDSLLQVYDESGQLVGTVEARLAKRLIQLVQGGNKYAAAVTTASDSSITIIIRETYQHPSQRGKLSFPPKALPTGAYRPYMREGALRYGMDDDDDSLVDYDAEDDDTDSDDSDEEVGFEDEDAEDEEEES